MGCASENDAAVVTIKAGTDMDMVSGLFVNTLEDALHRGAITEKMIDDACRRVLRAKQQLGLFDNPYKYCNRERVKNDIFNTAHREVARQIATETFVLLKNQDELLPLKQKGKIALIGPLADAGNNMCGCWSMLCNDQLHKSLLQAMQETVDGSAEILYAQGCNLL